MYLEIMSYVGKKQRIFSASEARARLGEVLSSAVAGQAVVIRRRGGRDAIVVDAEEYRRMFDPVLAALKRSGESAKRTGLNRMSMREINAEIAAARRERRRRHATDRS